MVSKIYTSRALSRVVVAINRALFSREWWQRVPTRRKRRRRRKNRLFSNDTAKKKKKTTTTTLWKKEGKPLSSPFDSILDDILSSALLLLGKQQQQQHTRSSTPTKKKTNTYLRKPLPERVAPPFRPFRAESRRHIWLYVSLSSSSLSLFGEEDHHPLFCLSLKPYSCVF